MNNILIVEDEILELEFLKSLAREQLCEEDRLFSCESGSEAIRLARKYEPNIIFMDILIPEVDGLTAIEEIRSFLPDACITILSAYSDFSYAQKAINLDVFKYLLKPIKPSDFQDVLSEMLKNTNKCKPKANNFFIQKTNDETSEQTYFINKSIKYIKNNFTSKLSLDEVASQAYMNPKYFSRVFKEETGTSFSCFVNELKIEYACKLLETTDFPAYRISMECGFSDPSYFNRVFSNIMDTTPMNYRKRIKFIESQ